MPKKKREKTPNPDNGSNDNERLDNYAAQYQEICDQIDYHISASSNLISGLDPLRVLQRAFGEYSVLTLGKTYESEITQTDGIARRMIDYVQCLIVSTNPSINGYEEITEELWVTLSQHIDEIFSLLLPYFIAATSKRQMEESFDAEWEELFTRVQMNWCFVKGDRHLNHLYAHLQQLLEPHNEVFIELFEISANQFVDEIEKIQKSLTYGLLDSVFEMKNLHRDLFDRLEAHNFEEIEEFFEQQNSADFYRKKMQEFGILGDFEEAMGRFLGLDLFDLEIVTDLPPFLLDNLAWEPGENKDFLTQEQFNGWPLSLWPTWSRPFLEMNGKYYCFDLYSLSDNLYRATQKLIFRLKPDYRETWNKYQQSVSEQLPLELLSSLLPGATIFSNVNYRWRTGKAGRMNWSECDGIVIYDDHVFIVEVKAGAFTYSPPATDAPAFIESIKSLLLKPVEQGQRFLEYFKSSECVAIFDESHK